jgi:exosortase H (IPTLxxWG-CTERM-specific)
MGRFVSSFIFLLLSLFVGYLLPWGQQYVSTPITSFVAKLCAFFMTHFDANVVSQGIELFDRNTQQGIQVVAGCNGMEAVIILFAALFAFPATWYQRFVGFFAGFCAIHALNVVRIVSLYYLAKYDKNWFEWFHLYIWQALIILDALVVWLLWLRWISKGKRAGGNAATKTPTQPSAR